MSDDVVAPDEQPAEAAEAAAQQETMLGVPITRSAGQRVLHPTREQYLDLLWKLRDEEHFEMATDLCAVDYLVHPGRPALPAAS